MFCHGEYLRWNIGTVIAENHRQFAIVALRNLVRECKFKILNRSHIVFVSLLANHVKKNEPYVNRGSGKHESASRDWCARLSIRPATNFIRNNDTE